MYSYKINNGGISVCTTAFFPPSWLICRKKRFLCHINLVPLATYHAACELCIMNSWMCKVWTLDWIYWFSGLDIRKSLETLLREENGIWINARKTFIHDFCSLISPYLGTCLPRVLLTGHTYIRFLTTD